MTKTDQNTETIESILKGKPLEQFKVAQKAWDSLPKNALTMLEKMDKVGAALNSLYAAGAEKGMKRDDITVMARKAFPGLDRRERSEYRKLANNGKDIKVFVETYKIKSANPTYLVNAWRKAIREDQEACSLIERGMQGAFDALGDPMNKTRVTAAAAPVLTPIVKKEVPAVKKEVIKRGFVVETAPLSGDEVATQLGYIVNQVKTQFNRGKLSADNLTGIEKHLTSCLQHINKVDIEADLVKEMLAM